MSAVEALPRLRQGLHLCDRRQPNRKRYSDAVRTICSSPAATLRPVMPSRLTGCNDTVLPEPPISTFAAPPATTAAPAVTPPYVPAIAPLAISAVGATTAHATTPPA